MADPVAPGPVVRMEGISKRFGPVEALAGANLTVRAGEVHAVLGENGAGKTTLLSVLAGGLTPDGGTVRLQGRSVRLRTPREAWRHGVGMVHQHFALVSRFTVLENLALGHRGSRGGFSLPLDRVGMRAAALADATGLDVPFGRRVEELGVGDRQRAEILKVLLRDPGVLVLDEPTAVLPPQEVDRLLGLLRHLAEQGRAVILVAHKLDEVLAVADRVTVLRRGRTVLEAPRNEVDGPRLTRAMVGGADLSSPPPVRPGACGGEVVAVLSDVDLAGPRGEHVLRGVSLQVSRGEIVGIAGVEGNGQRALARVLAGLESPAAGEARLPPARAFIPEDRQREGLVGSFTLTENVALALHHDPDYRRGPLLSWGRLRSRTRALMGAFAIQASGPGTLAGELSGGNQQRLVVARELGREPTLLVAENPTRGLDVAAALDVHRRLRELRNRGASGAGVVLISTDLDEILALSDRILVMVRGHLRPVPAGTASREALGRLMLSGQEGPP